MILEEETYSLNNLNLRDVNVILNSLGTTVNNANDVIKIIHSQIQPQVAEKQAKYNVGAGTVPLQEQAVND